MSEFEKAHARFVATKCSPGADSSEWYKTIYRDAWEAALDAVAAKLPSRSNVVVEHVLKSLRAGATDSKS